MPLVKEVQHKGLVSQPLYNEPCERRPSFEGEGRGSRRLGWQSENDVHFRRKLQEVVEAVIGAKKKQPFVRPPQHPVAVSIPSMAHDFISCIVGNGGKRESPSAEYRDCAAEQQVCDFYEKSGPASARFLSVEFCKPPEYEVFQPAWSLGQLVEVLRIVPPVLRQHGLEPLPQFQTEFFQFCIVSFVAWSRMNLGYPSFSSHELNLVRKLIAIGNTSPFSPWPLLMNL